jgi:transposase-like protein
VRDAGQVTKGAFYIALGVGPDGKRDVLGIWAAPTEGAKFWLGILTELKNRGVEDTSSSAATASAGSTRR